MNIARGVVAAILLFFVTCIAGQDTDKLPPSIRTSGEAIVMVPPDRAQIDIGVTTQANTSQAAAAENAKKLEATIIRLRQLLGPTADIKTISYTLSPNYRYPREGGEPSITGYTATNIVRVTIDDLDQVGKAIDAATQAGANRIQSLRFTLKDERSIQARALREASANARRKADVLAAASNLTVVRILSVVESSPAVFPVHDVAFARTETASTPIQPGNIEVRATVVMTVEVR